MVDTGLAISILPFYEMQVAGLRPTGTVFSNASEDAIKCYGEIE